MMKVWKEHKSLGPTSIVSRGPPGNILGPVLSCMAYGNIEILLYIGKLKFPLHIVFPVVFL